MSNTAAAGAGQNFTIDVSDLSGSSQLKSLAGQAKPLFTFATDINAYLAKPVSNFPSTPYTLTVTGSGSWKAGSVNFGLSASAKCQVQVVSSGAVLKYAPDLESGTTVQLPASAYPNWAYVVLKLDFDIAGNLAGAGAVGALGISGKINGSTDTSVTFCHVVKARMNLQDALLEAFNEFVFPFHPECAAEMNPGDIAQVNFTGSLACNLAVSYGVANVKFSAPGVASVLDSVTKNAVGFTLPAGKIDIGATASLGYTHTDAFTAIVQKQDASTAFLYILRADKSDLTGGLKITAAVSITTPAAVTVNAAAVKNAVNQITGTGGEQAGQAATQIASGLSSKLNDWIKDAVSGGANLSATWDRQQSSAMLFKYTVNLSDAAKLASSWNDLCRGDLVKAASEGGLVPDAGSGVSHQLNKSFTIGLQFFNLFKASSVTSYFQKTYVSIQGNGDIRYMFDIGAESDITVKKAQRICLVHFTGTFDQTSAKTASQADVDMEIELTATHDRVNATWIASMIKFFPSSVDVSKAQAAIQTFAQQQGSSGTLKVISIFKPSAYGRLVCSSFAGNAAPTNQDNDAQNWQAFHDAVVTFPNLQSMGVFQYSHWQDFNRACRTEAGFPSPAIANRRASGNWQAVTPGFWLKIPGAGSINAVPASYFMMASAEFMNLCEDLHALAGLTASPAGADQDASAYDRMLISVVNLIVKYDVNTDYAEPALAALLRRISGATAACQSTSGAGSLTCTFTLS